VTSEQGAGVARHRRDGERQAGHQENVGWVAAEHLGQNEEDPGAGQGHVLDQHVGQIPTHFTLSFPVTFRSAWAVPGQFVQCYRSLSDPFSGGGYGV